MPPLGGGGGGGVSETGAGAGSTTGRTHPPGAWVAAAAPAAAVAVALPQSALAAAGEAKALTTASGLTGAGAVRVAAMPIVGEAARMKANPKAVAVFPGLMDITKLPTDVAVDAK